MGFRDFSRLFHGGAGRRRTTWFIPYCWWRRERESLELATTTNRKARSAPFALPSVWDARSVVKPGSHFVKYDLRDGFFAIPVHPQSRNRLVVRHPATGRLLRCARLPFGYVDSPRLFCGLTEAIADEVRRRTLGKG
eukprot:1802946-Prymnesium_polylepis.1